MVIRKARKSEAGEVAKLLLLAMEDIVYTFINETDHTKAVNLITYFVKKEKNQYSYENCYVGLISNKIVAAVNLYDGEKLSILQLPIKEHIKQNYNPNFYQEEETQTGEIYIDSLGVNLQYQRQGLGTRLLKEIISKYSKEKGLILGLLVETENTNAKRLYLKLGFKKSGEKQLAGKRLEHLQLLP